MSNNLGASQLLQTGSTNPEVAVNTALGILDGALTETLVVDVSTGNADVAAEDYQRNAILLVMGASQPRRVNLPAVKRLIYITSSSVNTAVLTVALGTTLLTLAPGTTGMFKTDGTANGLVSFGAIGGGGGALPDIAGNSGKVLGVTGAAGSEELEWVEGGAGSADKTPRLVQYAVDNDYYGAIRLPAAPTPGNVLFVIWFNGYSRYSPDGSWNTLEWKQDGISDGTGMAWRVATSSDTRDILIGPGTFTDGGSSIFEVSNWDGKNIDGFVSVKSIDPPTATLAATFKSLKSLIIGAFETNVANNSPTVAGATVIADTNLQADPDGMNTGRSVTAFTREISGKNPISVVGTFSGTAKVNGALIILRQTPLAIPDIPDPTGNNGKFLGVQAGQYALLTPPSSGSGGGSGGGWVPEASLFASVEGTSIGSSPTIRYSHGISSVVKTGNGQYKITFETPFDNLFYAIQGGARHKSGGIVSSHVSIDRSRPNDGKNLDSVEVVVTYSGGSVYDPLIVEFWIDIYDPAKRGEASGGGGGGGGGGMVPPPVSLFASVQGTSVGNSPTLRYSRGVDSVVKIADGVYKVNFATPFADLYYAVEGSCRHENDGGSLVDSHLSIDRRYQPNSGKNLDSVYVVLTYQGAGIYDPKILEFWMRAYDPRLHM